MAISDDFAKIVPPVDTPPVQAGGAEAINPSALTVAQLARMLAVPEETVRRHLAAGAPASVDGHINLVHYAAWLNKELACPELAEGAREDGD